MNSDILIVGAGVIGLMTALECSRAGATVTLLDKSLVGQEASWAGGGILSPLYPWRKGNAISALRNWSERQYPLLAAELHESTGIDVELSQCGMLIADIPDQQLAENTLAERNMPFRWLDSGEVAHSHAGLCLSANPALLLPTIAQIRNPRLLAALKKLLEQQQVKIFENHQVTRFILNQSGTRVDYAETPHGEFSADSVVLTAGAWSPGLWPDINSGTALPIFPVKGQMLLLQAPIGSIPSIVLSDHQYIVPRKDGHVLVGSTLEKTEFNKVKTVPAKRQLKHFFDRLYPLFSHLPVIKHWAGIRPGSHGNPIISRHTEIENMYVNSGHFRNGLNLAPASARLVVDMIVNREPIVPVAAYRL
ncbi:MAG TPA: glycine oxidase ThiO [Crenotrichaceae bacterium]|nr:glycine oxidase ThiO [Crenotrichaceae bacterium]